ncbi:hypothetical protein EG829_00510 [bacterium]|nr:hypothetical protein [bacterium]
MNYQALNFWFSVINFFIASVIAIVVWWTNRDKVNNARFKQTEDRLLQLENDVKHPPSCEYHPRLESRIEKMRVGFEEKISAVHGDTREIKGSLNGLARAVDLINEHLINQGGKR